MTYEFQLPARNQQLVRLIAIGDHGAVRDTIHQLGAIGYADPDRWFKLMPKGRGASILPSTFAATPQRQSKYKPPQKVAFCGGLRIDQLMPSRPGFRIAALGEIR
ncbi:hypothetical protein PGN35_016110 [Nodosilinea sp. PGN35]|uniref:hypothetical protein n=1 Tax=Nodosilinea sp. PGN35 TaxID=3020489 RepID=UPI0023B2B140|nr:hypothetical protein [Nodosilinea sp. TSF1-S3]MDF0369432.1 hypothetical protein [Nodosilinea sp. TSF1-S3]